MVETSLAEARSHNVAPEKFVQHYRVIRDLKDAHKQAGAAVARAKKAAKADGVNTKALKLVEDLADLDADEADVLMRQTFRYAFWLELPIGTQAKFFEDAAPQLSPEAQAEQREWAAGDAGLMAGRGGEPKDNNPHAPGMREHAAWAKQWAKGHKEFIAGQKNIAGRMGKNHERQAEQDEPAPARGRNKGRAAKVEEGAENSLALN